MGNDAYRLLGQNGARELTGADGAVTFDPPAVSIHALNGAEATFTTLTELSFTGSRRMTALAASDSIYGKFSVIDVNAGAVRVNF